MPVKRRKRKIRNLPIAGWKVNFLLTGEHPPDGTEGYNKFEGMDWSDYRSDNDPAQAAWGDHRDVLLEDWIKHNPGTRPFAWWKYDAPEPRWRAGGTGDPIPSPFTPPLRFGIPVSFVRPEQRLVGIYAKSEPYDSEDPPRFETETDYLARLSLLIPEEKKPVT